MVQTHVCLRQPFKIQENEHFVLLLDMPEKEPVVQALTLLCCSLAHALG